MRQKMTKVLLNSTDKLYMKTIILITILIGLSAKAEDVDFNTLKIVHNVAQAHNLNSNDLLRIAYVESRFNIKAVRVNKNGTTDIGLFQINSVHWNSTCKDLDVFSVKGNTECAARLIEIHRKHSAKDKNWLGRYHSKTPSRKVFYVNLLKNAPIH